MGDLSGLDATRVERWVLAHVGGLVGPLEFALIAGGHSNLTYSARDAQGRRIVLRRPPLGGASGSRAHDMGREYEVLAALAPTHVAVPQPFALCTDDAVNDRPFYVMDHVDGYVIDNPSAAERFLPDGASRRRASEAIVDGLAALHGIDIDAVGLGGAARRDGFLARQLARMAQVWSTTKTRELPLMDQVHARLVAAQPEQRATGIVHSDYRFGNVIMAGTGDLRAVLDWELWTLGDVLADLGFLLNNWYEPGDDGPQVWMEVPPTLAGGFASRAEVVDRYAARTGFDLSDIAYYRAFQYWKVAVLAEGVKRRYESSQMAASATVDFAHLAQRVVDLADLADRHLDA